MGKQRSLRSKAVHIVSDLTTVLLNPISDITSSKSSTPLSGNEADVEKSQLESVSEEGEGSVLSVDGPDTSSFTAFLYSLLKDDYFVAGGEDGKDTNNETMVNEPEPEPESVPVPMLEPVSKNVLKESGGKRGLFSKGKQSLGKAMSYAARFTGFRSQGLERKPSSAASADDKKHGQEGVGHSRPVESNDEDLPLVDLPDMSHASVLLSDKVRMKLYAALPTLSKGRKWVLLYSTWKHGISLATLYRRSMLCSGLSLLVVGDRGGSVFGGLVDAPLKPSKSRRYQGNNSTFVFSDAAGQLAIYRPTGTNRYYTLCSPDFLALGGGRHFALYLDSDLLNGSSAASDTYGNSCLALSEDFEVKEIELWGFVYASRYEEVLAASQNEAPGICRW